MIDFRYHLVSLISVFLALAVGIILGAGPLKEPIGQSLTQQVESLRQDRDELRQQAQAADSVNQAQSTYVEQTAPRLLQDALTGVSVVVIGLPGADEDTLTGVESRLADSGANLTTRVTLAEDFLTTDATETLEELRTLDPEIDEGAAGLLGGLARGVVESSASEDEDDDSGGETSEPADPAQYLQILSDSGLIALTEADAGTAQLAIVVDRDYGTTAWSVSQTEDPEDGEASPNPSSVDTDPVSTEAFAGFARDLQSRSEGVVVAGDGASAAEGLVAALRSDDEQLSTVDGVLIPAGQVITVLAAAEQHSGGRGDYGFAAEDLLPPAAEGEG